MGEVKDVVFPNVRQVMLHFKPQTCYISCYIECNRPNPYRMSVYSAANWRIMSGEIPLHITDGPLSNPWDKRTTIPNPWDKLPIGWWHQPRDSGI